MGTLSFLGDSENDQKTESGLGQTDEQNRKLGSHICTLKHALPDTLKVEPSKSTKRGR
jgi:hypothetical protein